MENEQQVNVRMEFTDEVNENDVIQSWNTRLIVTDQEGAQLGWASWPVEDEFLGEGVFEGERGERLAQAILDSWTTDVNSEVSMQLPLVD